MKILTVTLVDGCDHEPTIAAICQLRGVAYVSQAPAVDAADIERKVRDELGRKLYSVLSYKPKVDSDCWQCKVRGCGRVNDATYHRCWHCQALRGDV